MKHDYKSEAGIWASFWYFTHFITVWTHFRHPLPNIWQPNMTIPHTATQRRTLSSCDSFQSESGSNSKFKEVSELRVCPSVNSKCRKYGMHNSTYRYIHGCRSRGGCVPPNFWRTWIVPPNKDTPSYSKLNKCIFRLHILHILESYLKGNFWNGGTNNVWQIYFWLHIPFLVSTTLQCK